MLYDRPPVPSRRRIFTILPGVGIALLVVAAGAAAPEPIASAIRGVLQQATLAHVLVIAGLVGALAVVASVVPNDLPARQRVEAAARPLARARDTLGSLVDRAPWGVSVTVIAAVAATAWYSLGRAATVPRIFADELIHAEAARALAQSGTLPRDSYGLVTPALDSIAYLLVGNDVSAFRLIQALNVAVMVMAAFPAYLLARRALSHRWALVVAALTVIGPWLVYARFVMTEAAFYPAFLLFVLALVRALERPTHARQLALALALVLAFATRTQAIVLVGAVVCAVPAHGLARGRTRIALRAFAATWAAYTVAATGIAALAATGIWAPLGAYEVLLRGWWHPHGLALWAAANVTSLSLGLGVLVVAACPLGAAALLRRRAGEGEQALAAAAISSAVWLLVTVVVLSQSKYGQGTVHERNLFFVAPLVFICAIAWATHGFPRPKLLTAATVATVVVLAVTMPSGVITAHSADALSFKLWTQLERSSFSAARQMIVAVAVGAVVLVRMRTAWPLILTVVLAAVGVTAASDYRSDQSRSLVSRYAWVDRTLPREAKATILWIGCSKDDCPAGSPRSGLAKMAVYTEFFNSRIDRVGHVRGDNGSRGLATDTFALRPDGVVTSMGVPLRPDFVVADARVGIVGSRIALLRAGDVAKTDATRGSALALWRVTPPLRLVQRGLGRK